jgi:hypothetical protein
VLEAVEAARVTAWLDGNVIRSTLQSPTKPGKHP